jgi:hypothetical protein
VSDSVEYASGEVQCVEARWVLLDVDGQVFERDWWSLSVARQSIVPARPCSGGLFRVGDSRSPKRTNIQIVTIPTVVVVPLVVGSDGPLVETTPTHRVLHHDSGRIGDHQCALISGDIPVFVDDSSEVN